MREAFLSGGSAWSREGYAARESSATTTIRLNAWNSKEPVDRWRSCMAPRDWSCKKDMDRLRKPKTPACNHCIRCSWRYSKAEESPGTEPILRARHHDNPQSLNVDEGNASVCSNDMRVSFGSQWLNVSNYYDHDYFNKLPNTAKDPNIASSSTSPVRTAGSLAVWTNW